MSFDVDLVKKDFPILQKKVRDRELIYLDNAATTQKPKLVLDTLDEFYRDSYATVHRGAYFLSEKATERYEAVRKKVAAFINAPSDQEIIYTKGTTDSINLVAHALEHSGRLKEGDEILISAMEHHSNIVPWQMLCEHIGCQLKVIPINDLGEIIVEEFDRLLSEKTKVLSINHVSNALGTINPVKELCAKAKAQGALTLVDGAQASAHLRVDVQDIDCDFYAFSGHKSYGPTGVGILYGRYKLLENLPPYQGGGDMILTVSFEKTEYAKPPARFEAGTPAIAEVIGLGAAIDYMNSLDFEGMIEHEDQVLEYGQEQLSTVPGIRMIGQAKQKTGVLGFVLKGAHPHDIATIVDGHGVSIRAGHHCAQPVMDRYQVPATARASLACYNTKSDIDALVSALHKVNELFGSD